MITPVILCGGSGTRLWPTSRKAYPKQFVPLIGEDSLFQMTLKRFMTPRFNAPVIMTGNEFRFMATDQAMAMGLSDAHIVVEPTARDTAPAILTAALMLSDDPDAMMLVLPSDHVIGDVPSFLESIQVGAEAALAHKALVTFGIEPDRPETGYGYLELSETPTSGKATRLKSFREKPDLATAEAMLKDGFHLWNGGIFLFRAVDVIAAFTAHAPDLMGPCQDAIDSGAPDLGFFRLGAESYSRARAISFDYAIMEKVETVITVPLDSDWSDLGAWDTLWQMSDPDDDGVALTGSTTAVDCKDTYLRSDDETIQVVGLGLDGIIAIAMKDAVLVADKARAQDVKRVVEVLRAEKISQADQYPRFHRPWGWYETLCFDTRFQVKRIMVKPGGTLSLQSHHHRSEHWIVVAGTAEVTIGDDTRLVTENESVYVPLGTVHRLANPGELPIFLIEVQTGNYFGEDDIIRYEDVYNRTDMPTG
jgi:mannose-1-phosphate guanylyltransferase/mannose-6-phosphate isomerase